ncbi:hypothetical protein EBT25_11020 [bacterium]|nr:hypothetical protein [bacterium]
MITLVEDNKQFNYKIYKSDVVVKHQAEMIKCLVEAHRVLIKSYGRYNKSSTWLYRTYNVFSLVGASKHFYDLFKDLNSIIRETLPNEDYLWFQSWLNFHRPDEVLKWHAHQWHMHGYISIDPKKTKTLFENYEIVNELGNIYIGPGNRSHMVQVLEPYDGHRITLGFDIERDGFKPTDQISLIPVI